MLQNSGTPYFDPQQPIGFWRNKLPHWEQTGKVEFITFRLDDSMPQIIVRQYRQLKEQFVKEHPYPWNTATYRLYGEIITNPMQKYMDAGYGSCVLKDPAVRRILVNAIDFFNNERFLSWAYVIMPNHVHMLATPAPGYELSTTISSVMRFSAKNINKLIGRKGQLWREEPFDTIIRNHDHYRNTLEYIRHNPDGLPVGSFELGGLEFRSF
ncbi:MAG: transposase [Muribaculaceae bacterium]|nr:transposase [Muribaculaceae bacterium]MDE6787068.1 transposase [Muribaculaceae bacterium]